jgi:PAS domain S-box-containing protein
MVTELEQDLSERDLPKMLARSNEAEAFHISLQLPPEAALLFAIDGTIIEVNSPALKLFEADDYELIKRNIYSLGATEPEKLPDAVAHLAPGTTIRVEMDLLTRKGNRRSVDITLVPVVTVGGKIEAIVSFARDITELKQIETERALVSAIVESSGDAIVSVGADQTITSWNPRAQEMLGFVPVEAIGQPLLIIIPPEQRTLAIAMTEEIRPIGAVFSISMDPRSERTAVASKSR